MLLVCHCGLDPQSLDKGDFKVAYAERRITLITPSCASLARSYQYVRPTVFYLKQ